VKYLNTGYCHTDLHMALGEVQIALPMIAGHECAGIVEEVGPGVTNVGTRVIRWSAPGWFHAAPAQPAAEA
jgi:Zn-dependent alcohol dehydrogenase